MTVEAGFHSLWHVHTHGNCSWSGVTRFYGRSLLALAGGHADLGNAYLERPHLDIVSFNASVHAARGSEQLHAYSAQ